MDLARQIERIRQDLPTQTIIAATKYVGVDVIRGLYALGIADIGENHAQALLSKQADLADLPIRWHFIGHLQTNKARSVVNRIVCLHSLDSEKLAAEIMKWRKDPLDCFIEVNISGEAAKTGMNPDDLPKFVEELADYDKIRVVGLMGMAEGTGDETAIQASFLRLAALKRAIETQNLPYAPCHFLSMGMSHDYRIAAACGSTHVRLGSILFRNEE